MNNKNRKNRHRIVILISLLMPIGLLAQDQQAESSIFTYMYDNIIVILGLIVIAGVAISIVQLIMDFIELQKMRILQESGVSKEEIIAETKVPGWKKLYDWAWSIVPVGEEKNIDLGHDYDGIRELDNRLPPWWLGIFYGTIVFAAVYLYYYQWGGSDWSSEKEYEMAMEEAQREKEEYLARMPDLVDETNVEVVMDESSLAAGKEIYMASCLACHGPEGQGLVGPNFTDEYWIHGGSITDLFATIKYGVPEKGMIAWNTQLRPTSIQNVASYILTMQGTDPPGQKAPEGELYVPSE